MKREIKEDGVWTGDPARWNTMNRGAILTY
jgi:hypothetical protein